MPTKGYKAITVSDEVYKKAEIVRRLTGSTSKSSTVTKLINAAYDEVVA